MVIQVILLETTGSGSGNWDVEERRGKGKIWREY